MKKTISVICIFMLVLALASCDNKSADKDETKSQNSAVISTTAKEKTDNASSKNSKTLVVNFSVTGNTKQIAERTADILGADFYEITPSIPYTDSDIEYQDKDCRANKEQSDDSARPEISSEKIDMEKYDTVIISFPIWWGKEPRIIDTFMESYDLKDKTLSCFCTSGSTSIDEAEYNLHTFVPEGKWLNGIRFEKDASDDEIKSWLNKTGLMK